MLDLWPYKSGLKERVAQLENELSAPRIKLSIRAAIGAGRHTIVKSLASRIDVAVVEFPSLDDLDAPLHGLVQLATHAGTLDAVLEREAGDFVTSTTIAAQALADAGRAVVVLLPVPRPGNVRESEATTQRQIEQMVSALGGVGALRMAVLATYPSRSSTTLFDREVKLEAPKIGARQIKPEDLSGEFATAASALAAWMQQNDWASTPLEARLQVGLIALGERPDGVGYRLGALARKLTDQLRRWPSLAVAVHRLLLARRPLPIAEVSTVSGVESRWLPLLTTCIGYGDDTVRVPEVTRQVLLDALDASIVQLESAHAALANYHESLDGARGLQGLGQAQAINWMEKVHHLALGGATCVSRWVEQTPAGPEQLWEHARYLSRDLHRYADAAQIYERCISTFGSDPYSRHYLAYNVDRSGGGLPEVRDGYAYAAEKAPDNPWWQQRWIRFLIAHGTLAEARAAWRHAIDAIDPDGTWLRKSSWLALNLHCWVARRWLATGHLEEARAVLAEVPKRWLEQEAELRELMQTLTAHEQALELGESVYPASTPISDRWQRPRGLRPARAGRKLLDWAPGRVVEASPTSVAVVVAPTSEEAQQVIFDAKTWTQLAGEPAEDAAGFFELGRYEDGVQVVRLIPDDGEGHRLDLEDADLVDRVTSWSP